MVFFSIFISVISLASIVAGIVLLFKKEVDDKERVFDTDSLKKQGALVIAAGIIGIAMSIMLYMRAEEDAAVDYPTMDMGFFQKDSIYLEYPY